VFLTGCRSPVQREIYSKQLSNEVRVLEDQLYDADYQNRVLRDELKRVKAACEPSELSGNHRSHSPATAGTTGSGSITPDSTTYGPAVIQSPSILSDSATDPMPLTDQPVEIVGDGYPTQSNTDGTYSGETVIDNAPLEAFPREPSLPSVPYIQPTPIPDASASSVGDLESSPDGAESLPAPARQKDTFNDLPPPRAPDPPGPDDFKVPPIEPGKLTPPPLPGSPDDGPPGRVKLPKGLDASLNYSPPSFPDPVTPDHIQLHPSLSSAHQFDEDDEADGLWVVVNVVDDKGRILDLSDFDIDASMTIVALDPSLDTSVARIGRWDFSVEEVRSFVRSIPVDGFHVPVKWEDNEPTGEEVIVHVRLQTEGEEMRCQGKLQLKSNVAMSKWLPRGGSLKR
jgi:hypothetical protein